MTRVITTFERADEVCAMLDRTQQPTRALPMSEGGGCQGGEGGRMGGGETDVALSISLPALPR